MNIPFRTDEYGKSFYIENEKGIVLIPYKLGEYRENGIYLSVCEETENEVLKISISARTDEPLKLKRFGFRLGIDTYMDRYPDWNEKYFPSALRCEKKGFWSCFMSPLGKILSVCSPSKIVSWRNEYSDCDFDIVGHRIYTSSVEFINTYPQPKRHPVSDERLTKKGIDIELYFACCDSEEEMYGFIEKYTSIRVPRINKYTLEQGEKLLVDGREYGAELCKGLNTVCLEDMAEVSVFVRRDWFYYLDCARKSAEICQQKPGTHCESWYGFFSRVLYASIVKDERYAKVLCDEFDRFFDQLTETSDGKCRMKAEALPDRLQNTSAMLSLLADFYELTANCVYLDKANDLAEALMKLQHSDGSYRNRSTHYTCVIYPAKSMLELALAERKAGLDGRYAIHFESAYKAIKNLEELLDNIQTEGQMTFEDGMISCESLQLGYLALLLPEGEERTKLASAAELVLKKHRCLEQQFLPDCRSRGCTARFWEARYDLNFFVNMINAPHGWTSWKNYATYYLYLLTGKIEYLKDTMDTVGACMQCVDSDGVLNWGYVVDPCIVGQNLKKNSLKGDIKTEETVVGECYLPMISDWWRQDEGVLINQYLEPWNKPENWDRHYGGSCDNDAHEHFKCLVETVFGKGFVHETDGGYTTYNCREEDGGFVSDDPYLSQWVVYSRCGGHILLNGKRYDVSIGINLINAGGKENVC